MKRIGTRRWPPPVAAAAASIGGALAGLTPAVDIPLIDDRVAGVLAGLLLIGGLGYELSRALGRWSDADVARAALITTDVELVLDGLHDSLVRDWPDGRQRQPGPEVFGASVYRVVARRRGPARLIRIVRRRLDERPESRRGWRHGEGVAGAAWASGSTNPHKPICGDFRRYRDYDRDEWNELLEDGDDLQHFNMTYEDFDAVRDYSFVAAVPIVEHRASDKREPDVIGVLTLDSMDDQYDITRAGLPDRAKALASTLAPKVAAWPSGFRGTLRGELAKEGIQ